MRKYYSRVLLDAFVLICSGSYLIAETATVDGWIEIFKSQADPEAVFLKVLDEDWPKLERLPETDETILIKGIELSERFLSMLIKHDLDVFISGKGSENRIGLYLDLSEVVSNSGGYFNYLISDSLRRLALSRVLYSVFDNPSEHPFFRLYLDRIINKKLHSLVIDNVVVDDLEGYENLGKLSVFLTSKGVTWDELFREYYGRIELFSSKELILQQNELRLVFRSAITDLIAGVHANAILTFLERGGEIDDIDPSDMTKFREVMPDILDFSIPELGISRMSPAHLYVTVTTFSDEKMYKRNILNGVIFEDGNK